MSILSANNASLQGHLDHKKDPRGQVRAPASSGGVKYLGVLFMSEEGWSIWQTGGLMQQLE